MSRNRCRSLPRLAAVGLAGMLTLGPAANGQTNSVSATNAGSAGRLQRTEQIVGQEAWSDNHRRVGRINDLVLDLEHGRVLYAVVSVDTFLGLSDRLVAVPPGVFRLQDGRWNVPFNKSKLKKSPAYAPDPANPGRAQSPQFVRSVYQYYGQRTWWEDKMAEFGNVQRVSTLIGIDVKNLSNRDLGHVNDVVVDLPSGRVAYVILAPDRSLGIGDNLYALPPNALTQSANGRSLSSALDRDKLVSAPHFDRNHWPDMSSPEWTSRVYSHFGKQAYFEEGKLQPVSRPTNAPPRIYHEPGESKR